MSYEVDHLRAAAQARFVELCRYLLPGGKKVGQEWRCGSFNGEPGMSLGVNLHKFVYSDFATGEVGHGPIDLWMAVREVDFITAQRELANWLGSAPPIPEKFIPSVKTQGHKTLELPEIELPTGEDMNQLALNRGLSRAAIKCAAIHGFLWAFQDARNGRCWLWLDEKRRCGLRRRLDGELFKLANGNAVKVAACPGSIMNEPMGYEEAVQQLYFAVVEGAPDGLAVYDQAFKSGTLDIAPIVMPCTSARFTPESLQILAGRKGRIFIDEDPAGKQAAAIWLAQLRRAGIRCDAYSFKGLNTIDGKPVKDLNDYCRLDTRLQQINPYKRPMAFAS